MDPLIHEKWKYEDPHWEDRGILLSNHINELCEQGLLISDQYESKNLRPASYTLRIGDDYIDSHGKKCRLTDEKDSFVFENNSIVFVSTKEKLDLPFYIVGRFNLRVNWVYEGVLLGTGPQVDPGFSGFLSCPLYNLTNNDLLITRGQDFATIDFEKTTTLLGGKSFEEKRDLIQKAADKTLFPDGGQSYSFYKQSSLKPLQRGKQHTMVSSLIEMQEEVQSWRRLGIGSLVAFFGLTLSLLGFGANLYRQNTDLARQNTDLVRQSAEVARQNADLAKQVADQRSELNKTAEGLAKLENQIKQPSAAKGNSTKP